jgi:hypothetical protein
MTSTVWGVYARPGSGFPMSMPLSASDIARRAAFTAWEEKRQERAAVAEEIRTAQAVVRARERVQPAHRALAEPRADLGRGLRKLREARQDLENAEMDGARAARLRAATANGRE